jgi:hypothetical protein
VIMFTYCYIHHIQRAFYHLPNPGIENSIICNEGDIYLYANDQQAIIVDQSISLYTKQITSYG